MTFKKIFLAIFTVMCSTQAFAASATNEPCWQHEENPATKAPYASEQEWKMDQEYWKQRSPEMANPISLLRAYSVYRSEMQALPKFHSDKQTHCFMGCRIAQTTDFATAQYVAWLKEDRDIKDCDLNTHFETADFDATVAGARIGDGGAKTREECIETCKAQIK